MLNRLVIIGLLIGVVTPSFGVPFYVHDVREVCHLPRTGNNGKVNGHDNGSSVLYNGSAYWFFADTLLDLDGDGVFTEIPPDGFSGLGTIASTSDLNAADCMQMTYRASGGVAQSIWPITARKSDECLLWPAGAVVANDQIYLYASGVKKNAQGACLLGNPSENFLSTINPTTLEGTRVVTTGAPGVPHFNQPFNVSEPDGCGGQIKWIYLVGTKPLDPPGTLYARTGYLLARVTEGNIATPAQYQYWNGSTWVVNDPNAAAPMFEEVWGANAAGVAYNQFLGRYLMIYTCNLTGGVCGRTANVAGTGPAALVGGWSERVVMYHCPGDFFHCYAAYQHAEYGNGSTLYLTTARLTPVGQTCTVDSDCHCANDPNPVDQCVDGRCTTTLRERYDLRLREVSLATTPPPAGQVLADAGRDYSPKARCDAPVQGLNGWSYKRLSGSSLTDLTYSSLWQWRGPDSVAGFPAPAMDEDTAFPGTSTDAVRVWQAPGAGTAEISGEIRKRYTCGDDSIAEIIRIQNNTPVATLWSATLNPVNRSALYNLSVSVAAGDSLGFKVKRGGAVANCDEIFFAPTINYVP
jgi:hypothetical protein